MTMGDNFAFEVVDYLIASCYKIRITEVFNDYFYIKASIVRFIEIQSGRHISRTLMLKCNCRSAKHRSSLDTHSRERVISTLRNNKLNDTKYYQGNIYNPG